MSTGNNTDNDEDNGDSDEKEDADDDESLENPFAEELVKQATPPISPQQNHQGATAGDGEASSSPQESLETSKGSAYSLLRSIIDEDKEYDESSSSNNSSSSSSSSSSMGPSSLSRRLPAAAAVGNTSGTGTNDNNNESGHVSEESSGSTTRVSFSGLDQAIDEPETGGSAAAQKSPTQPRQQQNRRQPVSSSADATTAAHQKQKRVLHDGLMMSKQAQQQQHMGSSSRRQRSQRWSIMTSGQAPSVALPLSGNHSESISDPTVIAEYVIEPSAEAQHRRQSIITGASTRRINPFARRDSKKRTTAAAAMTTTTTTNLLSSKLNRRKHIHGTNKTKEDDYSEDKTGDDSLRREDTTLLSNRRYKTGDYVLVRNVHHPAVVASRYHYYLVNRYGFPPGQGETVEERRGPYIYVLAKVKQMHFEEINPYYTVTRCDTGTDQRADNDVMEPLRSKRGEMAALRAARESSADHHRHGNSPFLDSGGGGGLLEQESMRTVQVPGKFSQCLQNACYFLLLPFLWVSDGLLFIWFFCLENFLSPCFRCFRGQAKLFLYGREPYICRMRWTMVNFVVVCSTWFMFSDQLRLAFFPPSADRALAATNLAVWIVLVLELLFQVLIRPEGYKALLVSDKAYSPTTVRYINAFHLIVELLSLGIFIPEFLCIIRNESCSKRYPFSFYNAVMMGAIGPSRADVFYGHAYIALIRLRVFSLVRHWRDMWITNTFINMKWKSKQSGFLSNIVPPSIWRSSISIQDRGSSTDIKKKALDPANTAQETKDAALTNASNIGTALMSTNSYRALVIAWVIVGLFPVVLSITSELKNETDASMTSQLQATNLLASDTSPETCEFFTRGVYAWLVAVSSQFYLGEDKPHLLTLDIQPYRCAFDGSNSTTVLLCENIMNMFWDMLPESAAGLCKVWLDSAHGFASTSTDEFALAYGIRVGSIVKLTRTDVGSLAPAYQNGTRSEPIATTFSVDAMFDQTFSIETAAVASVLLQLSLLGIVLGGLSILRRDAEVLVLGPLRRMLKIVARYARNPLVQPKLKRRRSMRSRFSGRSGDSDTSSDDDSLDGDAAAELELGSFETEQLITAVAKITDLLRKCWGVAGSDIISTNLATREGTLTEVFNPTVPGKSVYALFGFAAIGGFDNALRNLGGDVMPLINDVAAVLHGEVFRWGLGDSGQCNKNLGGAFLMVFRIGLVKEVIEKLELATDVCFSTSAGKTSQVSSAVKRRQKRRSTSMNHLRSASSGSVGGSLHIGDRALPNRSSSGQLRRKAQRSVTVKAMSLSLQSLPGIQTFCDRAVLGMLKSFAGIHRDRKILHWNNDFRLGAGVGAFHVSMIYGMDAGWAVEGAVGSEYKIDATYLSPHVNMASRMTSACKQYDVSIMLSQSVQELMSDVAQSKLRHLDTVTVKGSSVKQKIYTYDARSRGVDFFLHGRSEEQADFDADRYSPNIWNHDPDLKAMRQHVTDEFLKVFKEGHKAYIAGNWPAAIEKLEKANDLMFQAAVDEGYLEDEFDALNLRVGEDIQKASEELKRENGDGPSTFLLGFMKSHGGVAPKNWEGWHPLTRK